MVALRFQPETLLHTEYEVFILTLRGLSSSEDKPDPYAMSARVTCSTHALHEVVSPMLFPISLRCVETFWLKTDNGCKSAYIHGRTATRIF